MRVVGIEYDQGVLQIEALTPRRMRCDLQQQQPSATPCIPALHSYPCYAAAHAHAHTQHTLLVSVPRREHT